MPEIRTILLVDDEAAIRKVLCESLKRRDYTIIEAADGYDALTVSGSYREPIHVLVSDVMMPGITGYQLARELCTARPELRVVLISGFSEAPARLEKNWEFLPKPFSPAVLCNRLDDLCGRRPSEDALRGEVRRTQEEYVRRCREYDRQVSLQLDAQLASRARASAREAYVEAVRSLESKK